MTSLGNESKNVIVVDAHDACKRKGYLGDNAILLDTPVRA